MQKYIQKRIEELISKLKYPEDHECYKVGVGPLCRAKDIGLASHVICLEKNPNKCNFSLPFGGQYFCKCELRVFIAKELRE